MTDSLSKTDLSCFHIFHSLTWRQDWQHNCILDSHDPESDKYCASFGLHYKREELRLEKTELFVVVSLASCTLLFDFGTRPLIGGERIKL